MAVTVVLPGLLTHDTDGQAQIKLPAAGSVAQVLETLFERFPRLRQRILTERGDVRRHVNVFVENESIRDTGGLATPVRDGSEVFVLPAISGGAEWTSRGTSRNSVPPPYVGEVRRGGR
jgi:molybdopterin converting factor small subunit